MLKNTYQVCGNENVACGSFEFTDVVRTLFGKQSISDTFTPRATLACVRSYGASEIGQFRPKSPFDSQIGSSCHHTSGITSGAIIAVLFSGKCDPHFDNRVPHPHQNFLPLTQVQVALLSISYRKSYPTFAHWPSRTQTNELTPAPSGLPGRSRLKSYLVHKYHEGRFFDIHPRNNRRNFSDDHTEPCRHVHTCPAVLHRAVTPDVLLVLKAGC